jgi:hypothetical protein
MRRLQRLSSDNELHQFLTLWEMIENINLSEDSDSIHWTLTADGQYSASSTYACQFLRRMPKRRSRSLNQLGRLRFFF